MGETAVPVAPTTAIFMTIGYPRSKHAMHALRRQTAAHQPTAGSNPLGSSARFLQAAHERSNGGNRLLSQSRLLLFVVRAGEEGCIRARPVLASIAKPLIEKGEGLDHLGPAWSGCWPGPPGLQRAGRPHD